MICNNTTHRIVSCISIILVVNIKKKPLFNCVRVVCDEILRELLRILLLLEVSFCHCCSYYKYCNCSESVGSFVAT